jgi:hypothetical protein
MTESLIRRTRNISMIVFCLAIASISILCGGLSAGVGMFVYKSLALHVDPLSVLQFPLTGIVMFFSYVCYGVTLIFVVPFFNTILCLKQLVKPFRGNTYSLEAMPWFIHNALIYLVRYTFLDLVTPTPINVLFYRMMGMKIGRGVVINTTNISDACLIELGDFVVVGGSAHLLAHYSQAGFLIVSRLKIGKLTTIGLKSTVFGNVTIGSRCLVKPHAVVLPGTNVPDNGQVD